MTYTYTSVCFGATISAENTARICCDMSRNADFLSAVGEAARKRAFTSSWPDLIRQSVRPLGHLREGRTDLFQEVSMDHRSKAAQATPFFERYARWGR